MKQRRTARKSITRTDIPKSGGTSPFREAESFTPEVGIILGSGMSGLADHVQAVASIPYEDITDFPQRLVLGHAGRLVLGNFAGKKTALLAGRYHFYQGLRLHDVTAPVRLLAELGVKTLVVTCAAGGISQRLRAGDLMMIEDHINFIGNPLIRRDGASPRFVDMTEPYSPRLRKLLAQAAKLEKTQLKRGIYLATTGPSYETPAEIRAFARAGADAVGMSTVPEVIEARACGMEVCGIACITNPAAGRNHNPLSHSEVLDTARHATEKLERLIGRFVKLL